MYLLPELVVVEFLDAHLFEGILEVGEGISRSRRAHFKTRDEVGFLFLLGLVHLLGLFALPEGKDEALSKAFIRVE